MATGEGRNLGKPKESIGKPKENKGWAAAAGGGYGHRGRKKPWKP